MYKNSNSNACRLLGQDKAQEHAVLGSMTYWFPSSVHNSSPHSNVNVLLCWQNDYRKYLNLNLLSTAVSTLYVMSEEEAITGR